MKTPLRWVCIACASLMTLSIVSCNFPLYKARIGGMNSAAQTKTVEISPATTNLIGNVDSDPYAIEVPAGAFKTDSSINITLLEDLPEQPEEGLFQMGTVIDVTINGEQTRAEEPMKFVLDFDSQGITEVGEVLVGYYHENYGWYLIDPDQVDLESGKLTFTTYHFSTYAVLRADEGKRIDHFLEKAATEEFVRMTTTEQSNKAIEKMVSAIMVEGAGIVDNKVLELVTKGVIKQLPYGKTAIAIVEVDSNEILNTTLKVLGTLIAEEDSVLADITSSGSTVGAFAAAAGHFSKGDIDAGLQVMGSEIADNIPVIDKIKEIGTDVVEIYNEVITNVWYKPEMEEAYRAYKDGADGWFGYSVDAGNWEQLVSQMEGIFAKTRTDYINLYCDLHKIDSGSLTPDEWNKIGDEGMERLHRQFDERIARRAEIDRIIETQTELMTLFADQNLLDETLVTNPMYTGNEDLEMLMNRLLNVSHLIMADLGRSEIVDNHKWNSTDPFERDNMIPPGVLSELVNQFYIRKINQDPELYQNFLNEINQRMVENEGLSTLDIREMTDALVEAKEEATQEAELDEEMVNEEESLESESPSEEDSRVGESPIEGKIRPTPMIPADDNDPNYKWNAEQGCWDYLGPVEPNHSWNCEGHCFNFRDEEWEYDCASDCWVSYDPEWTYDCSSKCLIYTGPQSDQWAWDCATNCWTHLDPNYFYDCGTHCLVYVGPEQDKWYWDCANECLQYIGPEIFGYTWNCGLHEWIPNASEEE